MGNFSFLLSVEIREDISKFGDPMFHGPDRNAMLCGDLSNGHRLDVFADGLQLGGESGYDLTDIGIEKCLIVGIDLF